jgi:hypothetical protein
MKWRRITAFAALFLLFITVVSVVRADTIVQGFKAKTSLQPGLIVSLSKSATNTVDLTSGNDAAHIYGVVIDPSQAPVTVQQKGQQVFVATGGNYPVLVSDQGGVVKAGDYITISSVSGVGAKASDQPLVLGRALQSFDGKSGVITNTSDGHFIGRIMVSIIPGKNPLVKDNAAIPAPLKRFGEAITGHTVSALRIWISLVFFVISAIIATSILVVGIRSSITAIGRNPLSKKSIMKGLLQVITVAIVIFIVGTFGVYLLLKA